MANSLPQMQIVGPEHLLQVVTSLQVRLVQEMFKVDRLKVDGLRLGGGDTNPQDVRDDSDAGKWCWRQVNRGASNLVMIGGEAFSN